MYEYYKKLLFNLARNIYGESYNDCQLLELIKQYHENI